jgi:hypothetical protein
MPLTNHNTIRRNHRHIKPRASCVNADDKLLVSNRILPTVPMEFSIVNYHFQFPVSAVHWWCESTKEFLRSDYSRCGDLKLVEASWNVMAHAQKPDFVFRRNGRVHLNRRGRQFSRLLAAEVYASAVVMLGTACSEVVWRVLATHSIRQFPFHFPSRASPCAITFQLESTSHTDHKRRTADRK